MFMTETLEKAAIIRTIIGAGKHNRVKRFWFVCGIECRSAPRLDSTLPGTA